MKKFRILLPVTVLTLFLTVGCGCRNSKPVETMEPTAMPTTQATTAPTTRPTTVPTTVPTTEATLPEIEPTMEDGNGPLPTDGARGYSGKQSGITGSITG